jgi:3-hydroxyacyl-CoA dehydrogenase
MKEFHAAHGDDFKPSALLERLVAEGKGFKEISCARTAESGP